MSDNDHTQLSKIQNGIVIEHIAGGQALNVLAILGIDGTSGDSVSVAMNMPSDRLGHKDVVKDEGRELSRTRSTCSRSFPACDDTTCVRDTRCRKRPRRAAVGRRGCPRGPNHNCITTENEPVDSRFAVGDDGVRCEYCDTIIRDDLPAHILAE